MKPSAAIDQLARQPDGSYVAIWGKYLLRSAFQPIFAFGNGRMEVVAFEGLIRPFEDSEAVSPGAFFGSIGPMDRFGVETLTRNLHVLNAALKMEGQTQLFLNFDPSVFVDRAVSDAALRDLRVALNRAGIDPQRVVCELTEHKSGSEETLFDFVRSLKANGFKIALDDYGASCCAAEAGTRIRKAGNTMSATTAHRRVFDLVRRDEFGVERALCGDVLIRSTYQPIFSVGKRGQLKMTALRAGYLAEGNRNETDAIGRVVAAPLALRNFGHSASGEIDLYLDQSLVAGWTTEDLFGLGQHERLEGFLPAPRRVHVECAPEAMLTPLRMDRPFRRAIVNERPDDQLDAWISRLRPGVVRFEGGWIADLAQHFATRTLLTTLVSMLKRRGVRTLFEALDSDDLVGFAMDCGADLVQGAVLARPVVAGERIESLSEGGAEGRGAKIIPVRFGRGVKPTVA